MFLEGMNMYSKKRSDELIELIWAMERVSAELVRTGFKFEADDLNTLKGNVKATLLHVAQKEVVERLNRITAGPEQLVLFTDEHLDRA